MGYIIDVVEAIPDLWTNIDLFMEKMKILGINSDKSRSRALGIMEQLKNEQKEQLVSNKHKNEKQPFMMKSIITNKAIYVHVMKEGYYLNAFQCRYCGERQSKGG